MNLVAPPYNPTRSAVYRAPFGPNGSRPLDPASCARLLEVALARGGQYADLFFEYGAGASFSFEDGILKAATRGVSMGMGVRVQHGEATGLGYTEDLEWESLVRAAQTASQIAAAGKTEVHPASLQTKVLPRRYDLTQLSIDVSGIEKRALLERACTKAHALDARVVKADASFSEGVREILIATSDGVFAFDVQPMFRFGVHVILEAGGKRQDGSSGGGGRMDMAYFDRLSPEVHAERAVHHASTMVDAREAPAGEFPVILAPGDSGILLHEAVGHGLEADFNRKGSSNYAHQMGKPVASPLCTVVDDATLLESRGSTNVDDEGIEPGRSVLIENGTLVGYMHDRMSARHYKLRPTGNGRRESFASLTLPRMTNTILLAGEDAPEDMLKSVKRGIFAKRFGGGQVDIANGDFVFSLTESYLIEDGKLTAPLKGVNLIGNGPEVLRRVSMLGHDVEISDGVWTCGKDGQSVPVGVGCPTIKIDAITVGGTQMKSA